MEREVKENQEYFFLSTSPGTSLHKAQRTQLPTFSRLAPGLPGLGDRKSGGGILK